MESNKKIPLRHAKQKGEIVFESTKALKQVAEDSHSQEVESDQDLLSTCVVGLFQAFHCPASECDRQASWCLDWSSAQQVP